MKKHPPAISVVRARQLRRNATDAERTMWRLLREFFPDGRWRRQVPLRHYVADFASHRWKIVVEIDGGQHSGNADALRTATIEGEGYQVVRFWNNEVLLNPEGCQRKLAEILTLRNSPPSNFG